MKNNYSDKDMKEVFEKAIAFFQALMKIQPALVKANSPFGTCDKCGSDKVESDYGPGGYCRTCHLKRKESNYRKFNNW